MYRIRKPLSKAHQYLPTWRHAPQAELQNPHSLYTLSQATWTQPSDPCIFTSKQNNTHPDLATYSIPLVLREDVKTTLLYIYHTDQSYMWLGTGTGEWILHTAIITKFVKYVCLVNFKDTQTHHNAHPIKYKWHEVFKHFPWHSCNSMWQVNFKAHEKYIYGDDSVL